jgi:hypothetical protein
MSTNKALDKFTYYDTLSNLLPGIVFLWALTALGPLRNGVAVGSMMTGNVIIDPILFIVLSYVVGHILQFLSKYSVEPLLKRIFWKGQFFSDIFLVGAYRLCTKEELLRYIDFAESKLGFRKEDLSVLLDPEVITDESKEKKALQLSGAIYHSVDAKTQDTSAGQKAHIQNTFYSFFRNLSLSFLALAVMDLLAILLKYLEPRWNTGLLILFNLALAAVFFIRAKERGEHYVKGLFWSYF